MKFNSKLLLPALAVFSGNCQAFDWLFEPKFAANERYTDNLRMQINPVRDNLITTLSPGVLLGYMAENHALNANLNWNEIIYHGESELDFSEKLANINQQYTGERFKSELAAQYAIQSSINTQLDLDGSGNLQVQVPRTTRSIAPSFTYNFTERNSLQLSYNYVDVTFDRNASLANNLGYSDYDNQQYSATFIHTYSEVLSFNFTGAYSKFFSASDSTTNSRNSFTNRSVATSYEQNSTNFLYQGGLQYQFDELTQLAASVGMRQTENETNYSQRVTFDPEIPFLGIVNSLQEINTPPSSASGHVFSLSLNRKTEWGSFSANAGQQLNPSSSGNQQQTTNFSGNLIYNLNERWSTSLTASYLISEATQNFTTGSNNTVDNTRTLSTLTPNLRWRWTPEINLDLSYTYRQQDYSFLNDSAIGNNLQLQFSYQPQINRQVK